jgi:hypothetical protein
LSARRRRCHQAAIASIVRRIVVRDFMVFSLRLGSAFEVAVPGGARCPFARLLSMADADKRMLFPPLRVVLELVQGRRLVASQQWMATTRTA